MKFQNLSIIAGNGGCNARCPYCISKMTGNNIPSVAVNWRNFAKACRLAVMNEVTTVMITGKGEPTLFPEQISDYLRHMQPFEFPIIELQTNGLNFEWDEERYDRYLREWYELGLTVISISIVSFDAEANRKIYAPYKDKYIDLEKVIAKLHSFGFSVRLSCTLIKGGLDEIQKVKTLIGKAKEWQVEQLSLRKLAIPEKSENTKYALWSRVHRLSQKFYDEISQYLQGFGVKILTFDYGGEVFDIEGQNVCFTNALTINPNSETLRQAIFFPEGHLRFDWQYKGAVIF